MFFPTYFLKQVIKSRFSNFDAFAQEKSKDGAAPESTTAAADGQQAHLLHSMTFIDTNIFRDVSTTKQQLPADDAIYNDLKDKSIKVMRMRTSAHWLAYVALKPDQPDWYMR